MHWNTLVEIPQLEVLRAESHQHPVLIYKHSTTCAISATTLNRLERNWKEPEMSDLKPYLLDLLRHRSLSNAVAEVFATEHESPQILLLHRGRCVYHASHFGINYAALRASFLGLKR